MKSPSPPEDRLVIEQVASIDSTNAELLRRDALLPDGSTAAAVWLVAAEQTAGRGRRQRAWLSAGEASLTASFARDVQAGTTLGALPLAAGIAAADTLARFGVRVGLKWPNDLYLIGTDGDRPQAKAGGILCEARARGEVTRLVIGIGLNLTRPVGADRLDQPVGGLFDGRDAPPRETLVRSLGEALLAVTDELLADGFGPLRSRWRHYDLLRGRPIDVHRDGTVTPAVALDIDDDGALRVALASRPGEAIRLLSEEVSVRLGPVPGG